MSGRPSCPITEVLSAQTTIASVRATWRTLCFSDPVKILTVAEGTRGQAFPARTGAIRGDPPLAVSVGGRSSGPYGLSDYQSQPGSEDDLSAATTERPMIMHERHTAKGPAAPRRRTKASLARESFSAAEDAHPASRNL